MVIILTGMSCAGKDYVRKGLEKMGGKMWIKVGECG